MKSSGLGVRVEAIGKRRLARWLNLTRLERLLETANIVPDKHRRFTPAHRLTTQSSLGPTVQLPASWRLLRTPPADGTWNMACDLALMAMARTDGVGILRVYEWSTPTVSFGRHERTAGLFSAELLAEHGLAAVRRPTGGRALLHSREVTYSVTMPIGDAWRWTTAYDRVNERLLRAMLALNVPARIVGPDPVWHTGEAQVVESGTPASTVPHRDQIPTPHHESHVCFSGIAPGEIAVADRKLIASSVWRERGAYLQHGSILIHDDQPRLIPLLGLDASRPAPAAPLTEWLDPAQADEATVDRVESALRNAFRDSGNVVPWSIPKAVAQNVEAIRSQLALATWLWRR